MDEKPPVQQDSPAQPAPRPMSRRLVLVAFGLLALLGGVLYSFFLRPHSLESQGWEAFYRGDYDAASALFSKAIAQEPKSADAYTGRSWVELSEGEHQRDKKEMDAALEQAVADATEAIRIDPNAAMAYVARANAEAGLRRVPAALADLDEAIRCKPDCTSAYFNRARIAVSRSVKDAHPVEDLRAALRLNPRFAPAYTLLGMLYYQQHEPDEAIKACTQALQLDPKEAEAWLYRGLAYLEKGRTQPGEADIQQALKLDPRLR